MAIEFSCYSCSKLLRVGDHSAGKVCRCPSCGAKEKIPDVEYVEIIEEEQERPSLKVACPNCTHELVCDFSLNGTKGQCLSCKCIFVISDNPDLVVPVKDGLVFSCPKCNQLFDGKPEMQGRKGKCHVCNEVFPIELRQPEEAVILLTIAEPEPAKPQEKTTVRRTSISSESRQRIPHQPARGTQSNPQERNLPDNPAKSTSQRSPYPNSRQNNSTPVDYTVQSDFSALPDYSALPDFSVAPDFGAAASELGSANDFNPYSAPTGSYSSRPKGASRPDRNSSAEETRRYYLRHEASVKSLGLFYIIGGSFCVLLFLFYIGALAYVFFNTDPERIRGSAVTFAVISTLVVGFIGALYIWTGIGLRAFDKSARIVASIFAALGLMAFPIGTIINGYFLYLLQSQKGDFVFSSQYQRILDATPHIHYQISIITKIILWFFVIVIVLIVIGVVFSLLIRN